MPPLLVASLVTAPFGALIGRNSGLQLKLRLLWFLRVTMFL